MKADLHCHTILSDGTLGIDDLISLAKSRGITTLAVTDHDSLAGTVRAALLGKRHDIEVITGVEFSATDSKRNSNAHILCYLPDVPERLEGLCNKNSQIRKKAMQVMVAKTTRKFPLTAEFIVKRSQPSSNIFKQHIMHALLDAGYTTTIFGEMYDKLFSKKSLINVLVDEIYPEPAEIIEAIHEAGGIAVLAHPGMYNNFELLEELIPLGLDGVEVWHPENTPEQQELLKEIAKKHGLLTTGGSDFHGGYNAYPIKLGDYGPDEESLNQLLSYKAKKRRKQKKLEAQLSEK